MIGQLYDRLVLLPVVNKLPSELASFYSGLLQGWPEYRKYMEMETHRSVKKFELMRHDWESLSEEQKKTRRREFENRHMELFKMTAASLKQSVVYFEGFGQMLKLNEFMLKANNNQQDKMLKMLKCELEPL